MFMKALVQKEIRLLAPAYSLALLLAIVPVWLLPKGDNAPAALYIFLFWFGAMMLALSAFGREFGLRTLPLILAQPLERSRMWPTKTAVLAVAMASAFAAWCLSSAASIRPGMGRAAFEQALAIMHKAPASFTRDVMGRAAFLEMLTIGATAAIVTFAGGLWTTLLLRQVSAAFWFTILVPGAILFAVQALGGSDAVVVAALGLYSVLGFFSARRLFFRFQEAGWTGGVISFPGWQKADAALQPALRAHRPLAALFRKELQLLQVSLAGIGLLFLAHLGVVAVRKYGQESLGSTLRAGLEVFGGLWLLVPFLVASSSVAEDRKLYFKLTEAEEQKTLRSKPEGEAQLKSNRQAAEQSYLSVIGKDPSMIEAYLGLGFLYEDEARKAEAVQQYQRFLQVAPAEHYQRLRIQRRVQNLQKGLPPSLASPAAPAADVSSGTVTQLHP